nr:porin family protein [uncultured Capnocytophaga sp.]
MKKYLFFLLCSFFCKAQEFDLGLKGGLSYVSLRGNTSEVSSFKGKMGAYVGGYGQLFLGRVFSLQPEILFSRQGAKWERTNLLPNGEVYVTSMNTDYINVPILANIHLHEKYSLQIGPQFGFMAVKPEIGAEEPLFNGSNYLDKNIYRTFDFAISIGLKVRLTDELFGELRYTNSLTNLFNKEAPALESANFSNNNTFRHTCFSLGIAYRLKQLTIF